MNLHKVLLALTLAISSAATAEIVTIVNAVETVTSNISVPTTPSGRLMFRPCDAPCDEKFVAIQLTPSTVYTVRGNNVDFLEFRRSFFDLRRDGEGYALVSYDMESKAAMQIRIGT